MSRSPKTSSAGSFAVALALGLALTGLLASGAPRALAQDRQLGGVGITVFQDPDYRGRNATFRDDIPDLNDYRLNDRISSFRVARGEYWEVCEHVNYGGRCTVFSGDEPDLARVSWNDQISSLRRVRGERGDRRGGRGDRPSPGRSALILYDLRDLRGQSRELERPESLISDPGDRASSVNVRGGPWEICDRPNFGGRCVTVTGEVPDLRALGFGNRIASARPLRGDPGSGSDYSERPPRRPEEPRLILYSRPSFRGEAFELTDSDSEFSGFSDRAQSARVEGGTWQVCEHKEFRGRCATISRDVPDLSAYNLRDALTSARPVYGPPR